MLSLGERPGSLPFGLAEGSRAAPVPVIIFTSRGGSYTNSGLKVSRPFFPQKTGLIANQAPHAKPLSGSQRSGFWPAIDRWNAASSSHKTA